MSETRYKPDVDEADIRSAISRFKNLPESYQHCLIEQASRLGNQNIGTSSRGDTKIDQKLPEESEEAFRLRRFTELLKNLPGDSRRAFTSEAAGDVGGTQGGGGLFKVNKRGWRLKVKTRAVSWYRWGWDPQNTDAEVSLNPELFKVKTPNLRGGGGGAAGDVGGTQGGGGESKKDE